MSSPKELLIKVETLQNMLISYATGGRATDDEYKPLRRELLDESTLRDQLPRVVHTCRDLHQFWPFIQEISPNYKGRREYLWAEFGPIIEQLEQNARSRPPSDDSISETLANVNSDTIHQTWRRALDRRFDDPDGAITISRTLLETVCKHILDLSGISYGNNPTLPELYKLTSQILNLAPGQRTERELKRIFGCITGIIEGIGSIRNILGDSHGKGADSEHPQPPHAELAVNLAGTLATFLIDVWESKKI